MSKGFLWRKYILPYDLDGGDGTLSLQYGEVRGRYPQLTRWDQMGGAEIGFVHLGFDGPPIAVCYDLQGALALFNDTLGKTGSMVVDMMNLEESFRTLILAAFMGSDTPFFWTSSNDWRTEVNDFIHGKHSGGTP